MFKVAVTGHRLERIRGREKEIENWLKEQFKNLIACYDDILLLDGMAEGVDQMAAYTALKCGVGVSCYFAFKEKMNHAQTYIAKKAVEIQYIDEKYSDQCFFNRDCRMIDDCDLLIVVWDGKEIGGTYEAYQYAIEKGKNILIYDWN